MTPATPTTGGMSSGEQPSAEHLSGQKMSGEVTHAVGKLLGAHLSQVEHIIGRAAKRSINDLPAWLRPTAGEPRWPSMLAVLIAAGLQLMVPVRLSIQPRWLLPSLEILLLVVLTAAAPRRLNRQSRVVRLLGLGLVATLSLANAWSAARLVIGLAHGTEGSQPIGLLMTGGTIWITNVIAFALWYWEFDRGGPVARALAMHEYPNFLFPQMQTPELAHKEWEPQFADYLYVSFTNAAAFSPTDTMPLSRWAKMLMLLQASISLITLALVIARAVNILK